MKKNITLFSLASLILITSALPSETLAAKIEDDKEVQFGLVGDTSENKEPVKIPGAVNIGEHSKFSGQVAVTNFPKLSFDSQELSHKEIYVDSKGKSGEVPGFRVDDISGTGAGWTLSVSASDFVRDDNSDIKLSGASLVFPKAKSKTFVNNKSKGPNYVEDKKNPDLKETTIGALTVPFDGSDKHNLLVAKEGQGMGAWEVAYDSNSKIKLQLPSGQLLGNYEATVTYSLSVGDMNLDTAK
ncbi:WxL domain-containing protein [Vagococcus sp.]|uniref:WxL domain-containing protein n=1 Tax=Vagococcus sp. TaxID=1933889 RepID=UPI002FC7401D